MFVLCKGKVKNINYIKVKSRNYTGKIKQQGRREKNGSITLYKTKINKFSDKGNVWYYDNGFLKTTKDKFAYKHPAMFPEKLAEDHIYSWSNENDIILDPMCGAGTTLKMAVKLKRNYIGIDISKEYCEIGEKRIKQAHESLSLIEHIENKNKDMQLELI
jgi:site-specific DNA-methyltransferase (adenine-specific)